MKENMVPGGLEQRDKIKNKKIYKKTKKKTKKQKKKDIKKKEIKNIKKR
jgi:hypothetical protein